MTDPIPVPIRMAVYHRDNDRCRYCGQPTRHKRHPSSNPRRRTCDHVLPRSRGGTDDVDNLVTACGRCNEAKGDRTPEEAGMPLLPLFAEKTS